MTGAGTNGRLEAGECGLGALPAVPDLLRLATAGSVADGKRR